MTQQALVELRDFRIEANIGTYGPADVVPEDHLLDLTLTLAPNLVQIADDNMGLVFDYDPLIEHIESIATEQHYETQEYLISRIVEACAACPEVAGLDICLRKRPVRRGSGSLGVRLVLGAGEMVALRAQSARAA